MTLFSDISDTRVVMFLKKKITSSSKLFYAIAIFVCILGIIQLNKYEEHGLKLHETNSYNDERLNNQTIPDNLSERVDLNRETIDILKTKIEKLETEFNSKNLKNISSKDSCRHFMTSHTVKKDPSEESGTHGQNGQNKK